MQNYSDIGWIAGIIIVYLCCPVLLKNIELLKKRNIYFGTGTVLKKLIVTIP